MELKSYMATKENQLIAKRQWNLRVQREYKDVQLEKYKCQCNFCKKAFQGESKHSKFCPNCKQSDRYRDASIYEGRY
jgi:Zn finger protein HypA/HybF involved in hydrogenase expression